MSEHPGGPLKVLRFFERGDAARAGSLPAFESFVFAHGTTSLEDAQRVRAFPGVERAYAYYNLLERGDPAWRSPWFDFVRDRLAALISPASRAEAQVPWDGHSTIFDWPRMGYAGARAAVQAAFGAAPPGFGLYCDQLWLWPRPWMFAPEAPMSDWPPHYWILWFWAMSYVVDRTQRQPASSQAPTPYLPALFNGDDSAPGPRLYEHAEWAWERTLDAWHMDYIGGARPVESVLAVDAMAEWTVGWLLDEWAKFGGWIAFTTATPGEKGQAAVDRAYERADELRRSVVNG